MQIKWMLSIEKYHHKPEQDNRGTEEQGISLD
jgi:hypothetical protein